MEQRHREPEHLLHHQLRFVHIRMLGRIKLLVEIVFSKSQDGDHIRSLADSELDEPLALLENQFQRTGLRIEGFTCATDDDRDGAAHSLAVRPPFERMFSQLSRDTEARPIRRA